MNYSENQLRVIIDTIPTLAWSARPDGSIEFVNQRWLDYTGISAEETLDLGWKVATHPEDLCHILDRFQEAVNSGQPFEMEGRLRRFDGEFRWFLFRGSPLRDESGKVVKWYGTNTDLEDRKRTEEALRASEQSFRLIVDSIPGLVGTRTAAGGVEFVNKRILDYYGKTLEEVKGWTTNDTVHPDDLPRAIAAWTRMTETGHPHESEYRLRRSDGAYRWFHFRSLPLRDTEGRIVRWYSLLTDIEERKKAEEKLRRSEANLAEAQKLSHTGSFGWDVSSGEINWSRETFRIFEYDPASKITIKQIMERTHPEDRSAVQQLIERVSREMTEFNFEHRLLMPDGSVKHLRVVGHPSKDESGSIEFVGAVMDITEEGQLTHGLRRSEAYLAEAQRLSLTGSFGCRPSTGEMSWSEETFRIFGYDRTITPAVERILQRVHPVDRAVVQERIDRATRDGTDCDLEYRLLLPDDSIKHVRVVAHASKDESGAIEFVGAVMDITAAKQAEEKLRRSEADLLEAQRLSHTGSYKHDVLSGIVTSSPESHRIWGTRRDDDTSDIEFWFSRMHAEDRQRFREVYQRCFTEKAAYEADFRILLPDGTIKHQHSVGHPVLSEAGELVEFVGATMDVTEQVQARAALEKAFAEIKLLKDQLYKENIALREEIDKASMFEEIVGESPALQAVLARVAKVALTDSTVLITGETGTGKELFARAIHKRSRRSSRAFVSLNCAATPAALIASELFGHEKGAFTGALQRRLGRFELSEGGTIFLDEIGELPAETQIALLRVLQEREFERVGGSQPIRADVRVIAATNRDLEGAIARGAFRKDLFYRLNVFPIEIPPLRERREDIPTLIEYFLHRYSRKVGKKIATIEKRTLDLLKSYTWPGNIRELQNVIERSVIVCETDLFSVDPSWLSFESSSPPQGGGPIAKMSPTQEREAIETALAATEGRVSGPWGAAAHLNIPPSTLESKIRSLKINKYRFKSV